MAKYQGHYSNQGGHYIGAWGYVGLQILYLIPIIGLIFLLVHACSPSHENRCKFARSFFCWILLAIIIVVIVVGIYCVVLLISGENITHALSELWENISTEITKITENGKSIIEKGKLPTSR